MMREENSPAEQPLVSIVILNYKRRDALLRVLDSVLRQEYPEREVILVDNHSEDGIREFLQEYAPEVRLVELPDNLGACGGRNAGIRIARGEIIVTLDNDIYLSSPFELRKVVKRFRERPDVHVLAFQLCEADSGKLRIREWCHPRNWKEFSETDFETDFFVEGACACRREVYSSAGLYYEPLFIGVEGHDLALRFLEHGFRILYCPEIRARHLMSAATRTRERPYYFYTRNYIWIARKDFPMVEGLRFLIPKLLMMLYFSLRTKCIPAFLHGIKDGWKGLKQVERERTPLSPATLRRLDQIEKWRPSLFMRLARHRAEPQI